MNRVQFLSAAINLRQLDKRPNKFFVPTSSKLPCAVKQSIEALTVEERGAFTEQIHRQLVRERRRCNSRAGSYDANRHIQLYVLSKAL